MSCYNSCNSNSAIEQAIDDALADWVTELDGFKQSASNSAAQAASSASSAANSAQEAKDYRDQAQEVANTASGLVPALAEASNNLKEASDNLLVIADKVSSYLVTNYRYTVVGGESTLTISGIDDIAAVQAIYIEGVRQDNGDGFVFDRATKTITFAETFTADQAGTVLVIQLGTLNADAPEAVLSMLVNSSGAGLIGEASGTTVQQVLNKHSTDIAEINDNLLNKVNQVDYNAAMALKAPLASPTFTGTPKAPTAAVTANDDQVATAAFVQSVVARLVDSSPAALDTLNELAAALGDDPNFATTMSNALGLKAPLANPNFTGIPTVPTAAAGVNTTQAASTAFVTAAIAALAALKASKGINNDITSLTGLTTPLSIAQGGRGQTDVSYVRAEDLTAVTIGSGAFTMLSPAETLDTKDAYVTGTWTCPADGYYQISGSARFANPATASCVRMIKIDSSTAPSNGALPGQTSSVCSGADQIVLQVNAVIKVTAGSKLSLYAYHNDSTTMNIVFKSLQILRVA